jgi:hypothetical protein
MLPLMSQLQAILARSIRKKFVRSFSVEIANLVADAAIYTLSILRTILRFLHHLPFTNQMAKLLE